MDVGKILSDLRQERDQLEEAILSLERLSLGQGKRRGRPPAWLAQAQQVQVKKRGRPPGSKNKPSAAPKPTAETSMTASVAA
jgi:hypothetical protein